PVLSGTAEPLATVAVQLVQTNADDAADTTVTYAVTADAAGTWSFDLSDLDLLAADYRATVWQVVGSASSPGTVMDFSVAALQVDGLMPVMGLRTTDAATVGIVITIVAPGQQTACLKSNFGQETRIALDANGTATRRLRFVGVETFELEVAVCEGDRRGPATRATIIVYAFWGDPGSAAEPGVIVEEP
ncbi:MAG: hypothetical protein KIT69_16360, partial [Propionibacteriaceae bacterium]|nr:hypothetical protein [Propionibacteriaceae bacterium]